MRYVRDNTVRTLRNLTKPSWEDVEGKPFITTRGDIAIITPHMYNQYGRSLFTGDPNEIPIIKISDFDLSALSQEQLVDARIILETDGVRQAIALEWRNENGDIGGFYANATFLVSVTETTSDMPVEKGLYISNYILLLQILHASIVSVSIPGFGEFETSRTKWQLEPYPQTPPHIIIPFLPYDYVNSNGSIENMNIGSFVVGKRYIPIINGVELEPVEAASFGEGDAYGLSFVYKGNTARIVSVIVDDGIFYAAAYGFQEGDVITVYEADESFALTSPNGTKYKLTVTDDGTLTTTAV